MLKTGVACVIVLFSAALADAQPAPVERWTQQLDSLQSAASAAVASADASSRLGALRAEIERWVAGQQALEVELPPTRAEIVEELNALRAAVVAIREATTGSGSTGDVFYLGRVDVAVSASAPSPGVTVLNEQSARTLERSTFAGLFALAPGITASKVGPRNEDTLYLRGFDLRQTPLYVDGIPVYVPYDGYVDLSRFLTSDVGEVRISRGLTSNLYGPNTLGGAINVVSRQPTARFEAFGNLSFRSGNTRDADVQLGSQVGRWYAAGGVASLDRGTYPLADDFAAAANQPAGDRLNAYAEDRKVHASVGYASLGGAQYTARAVSQRGEKGNPVYAGADAVVRPRFWQWPYWDKDSVYGIANLPLGDATWIRARGYYDTFENSLFSFDDATYTAQVRPSSFRSQYDDYTVGTSVEAGRLISPALTVRAVGHAKRDIHREANVGEPQRRFEDVLLSGGAEVTANLSDRATLVGGLSVDSQQTLEAQDFQGGVILPFPRGRSNGVNPQVSFAYAVNEGGRVHAGVSRKTRLPSIKDRFSYRMGAAIPNPDLDAEHATSIEAGYETRVLARSRASVTGFSTSMSRIWCRPLCCSQTSFSCRTSDGWPTVALTSTCGRRGALDSIPASPTAT